MSKAKNLATSCGPQPKKPINNISAIMTQPLPEVHIIGDILHGYQFSSANAFAKFDIESGEHWDCVGGEQSGQTQVDYPKMV